MTGEPGQTGQAGQDSAGAVPVDGSGAPRPAGSTPDERQPSAGRLPLLLEAVLSIGSDLGLRATLQQIVDTATTLTGARHGALGVLEPDQDRTEALYTTGMTEAERQRIGRLLPDRRAGLPTEGGRAPGGPPARAFLTAPIQVHTELYGHLCLAERSTGAFSETDRALLQVLAAQAGIAIGNARLYESARQRERWIEGAAAVTTALLTGTDAADALMTVAERARVLADASAGVILQPTEAGGMEIVTASTLDDPAGIVGTTIAPGSPVLVQLLGGEPVFIDDSATDPRMTTEVRSRFGPSMMLPLQSGGRLIGTLALPRRRGEPPYTAVDRLLATQFASQAALALVMADAQADREQLAVYEDRDRIARDLHDLVVQRLFATEMMLESTRRRATAEETGDSTEEGAGDSKEEGPGELLGRAVDELDSTIQEVRTAIFALQQPPAEAPSTFRGRVLRETGGASALLGFPPSVHFTGAVDALVGEETGRELLAALRGALAAAHRRPGVSAIDVEVDATVRLPDGRSAVRLVVADDGRDEEGGRSTTVTWQAPI